MILEFEQDRRHGIHTLSRLFETSTDPNLIGKQALELTNEFRKKYGLPPLKWHETLAQIGRKHSEGTTKILNPKTVNYCHSLHFV
jgi:hypothetical protein